MGIIKIYHDKKWTLQFLDALYNSIDIKLFSAQVAQIRGYFAQCTHFNFTTSKVGPYKFNNF
jgi:hypothetical protein